MTWRLSSALLTVLAFLASAGAARADVVTDWNRIMVATVSSQNPFAQARIAAITHLAMFEAVNAIAQRYEPHLPESLPVVAPASPEAAAIAAAHRVLATYFPASAAVLDAARAASLATLPDNGAKLNGIAVGEAAGSLLIASRASDGSAPPQFHVPASDDPGVWQLTPSCPPAGGVLAHWRHVTPFGVQSAEQFRSPPPRPLTSLRYARDLNEVKAVGSLSSLERPPHASDVARYYAAVLAVATWNPVAEQVMAGQNRPLAYTARVFALMNMAMSDALVSVMDTKYSYAFWRPETAIRNADRDGNRRTDSDTAWEPFIVAPCFPSYGSAHAAASHAARRVLESLLGDHDIVVTLAHPAVPGIVLEYEAFEEITSDIDMARIYGGIHFRFDQRAGARQGKRIGAWVLNHNLRPRRNAN